MDKRICMICLIFILMAAPAAAANVEAEQQDGKVTLTWDPNQEADLAGYKIYWGRGAGNYTNSPQPTVGVSANPQFTTPALPNGTWYFAVTAYNTAGKESGFSNEVSITIAMAPVPPKGLRLIEKLVAAIWKLITFIV